MDTQKNVHGTSEALFPALKHRPAEAVAPPAAKTLTAVRSSLQRNPDVNLPDDAAGVVTAGLVDHHRFRMLIEPHVDGSSGPDSLLNRKRVSEGVVFVTPQHDRFLDMGIVPDVAGARWTHTLHNRLDVTTTGFAPARLDTASGTHGSWAMIELTVDDHDEFSGRIREAFTKTGPDDSDAGNDYTDSILQSGVKEPLLLVLQRVVFRDGSADEYYLTTIDGNSRLVSAWKARTGGNVDEAATACIAAVIGTSSGRSWRRVTQRQCRDRLTVHADLINKGLQENELTERTIRAGHTFSVPAIVVVGGRTSDDDRPLTDLLAAREDLLGTVHTDTTPWDLAARSEQGMARVLRRAVHQGLVTKDERRVVEGRVTPQEMHEILGLPPHRLWAAALTLQIILNPWFEGMQQLVREEFNVKQTRRTVVGKSIASTALSGYRSAHGVGMAANAFADGGPMSSQVWDYRWYLDSGSDPVGVLDDLLASAEKGRNRGRAAAAQLCVLGGTAAMIDGLITRDRGSKRTEDGKRTAGRVPFRTKPYLVVEELGRTTGGLRILHSMAVAHVTGRPAKRFHTTNDPDADIVDGAAVVDAAGAHASLEMEWDEVCAADSKRAQEAIVAAGARPDGPSTKQDAVRHREDLQAGTRTVVKAVNSLVAMAGTAGPDVFGSHEAISAVRENLQEVRDILGVHGPRKRIILDDGDEEFDDGADEVGA